MDDGPVPQEGRLGQIQRRVREAWVAFVTSVKKWAKALGDVSDMGGFDGTGV